MKISVIIPVYNASKYLHRCLDSVLNQTYDDWEVIAINDGSEDNSYSILLEYSQVDSRFKVFSHSNHGPGYTRNKALEHATGKYIVYIDSDDYIENYYFEELAKCIKKEKSDVVFIDIIQEKPCGKLIRQQIISRYRKHSKDRIIRNQMTGKLPWGGWRKAVKASIIVKHNIRYTLDDVGEEALYSLKVLLYANKISFIDRPCYHYVNYTDSQSKKGGDDPWSGICLRIADYLKEIDLFDKYENTINSFGYTALIVSIYRISQNHKLKRALRLSRKALINFKDIYSFQMDYDSLELRLKLVLPFVIFGSTLPIILASKLKAKT